MLRLNVKCLTSNGISMVEFQQNNKNTREKNFKAMELDDFEVLLEKSRRLDYYQRKVVEKGIQYARSIVKSLKTKNPLPDAPKLMIHGGAGAGKS